MYNVDVIPISVLYIVLTAKFHKIDLSGILIEW